MLIRWQSHQEYLYFLHETKNIPWIFPTLILMVIFGFTSLTAWTQKLREDSMVVALIGSSPWFRSSSGVLFWPDGKMGKGQSLPENWQEEPIPKDKNGKSSKKPGKVKKLLNRHSGQTERFRWYGPLACSKTDSCLYKEKCSSFLYGRCVYTKPVWDIHLYSPISRGTEGCKKT